LRAELASLDLHRLTWRRAKRGIRAIAGEFTSYDLLTYSSAIAFQVLYAVLPLTLLALAGLGVVHWQSLYTSHIAPSLKSTLSQDAYRIANRTAMHVMTGKRVWWTTIGLVVTLWGSGAALRSMMTPLNNVYGAKEHRSWGRRIAVSIGGGALGIVCIGAALLITLLAPLWNLTGIVGWLFWIVRWLATLALLVAAIAAILWIVPARKRPIQWISVGTALCTVCWVVATLGFGAYISYVSYSSFYGAVAGIVLLLIYLHVSTIAFLLGVVVDSLLRDLVRSRERPSRPSSTTRSRSRPRRTARG
jgi:membrane protein